MTATPWQLRERKVENMVKEANETPLVRGLRSKVGVRRSVKNKVRGSRADRPESNRVGRGVGRVPTRKDSSTECEATSSTPRCLALARKEIRTAFDFAAVMSALISDIIEERVDSDTANAICNAGGKLLKVIELQQKYGTPIGTNGDGALRLVQVSR